MGKGKEIVLNLDRERLPHEKKASPRQIDASRMQLYAYATFPLTNC